MAYQTPSFYDSTQKVTRPMDTTDDINPLLMPISVRNGNQIQNLADGMYVGPQLAVTTYYVNNATGNDSNAGTRTNPFVTIDKALQVASSGSPGLLFSGQIWIALQAGQQFPMNNDSTSTVVLFALPSTVMRITVTSPARSLVLAQIRQ